MKKEFLLTWTLVDVPTVRKSPRIQSNIEAIILRGHSRGIHFFTAHQRIKNKKINKNVYAFAHINGRRDISGPE